MEIICKSKMLSDSDNSFAGYVEVKKTNFGNIKITLENPHREIEVSKEDFDAIWRAM